MPLPIPRSSIPALYSAPDPLLLPAALLVFLAMASRPYLNNRSALVDAAPTAPARALQASRSCRPASPSSITLEPARVAPACSNTRSALSLSCASSSGRDGSQSGGVDRLE